MSAQLHTSSGAGVYAYDMPNLPWQETGRPGIRQKAIRADRASGHFLGLVAFEPMISSGVHQHHGPATSLMLGGSLSDYQDNYGRDTITINLDGTTHDAITWEGCSFVSRLEGATSYLPANAGQGAGHVGAGEAIFANPRPEEMPALDFPLRSARQYATSIARLSRRMLFDYSIAKENHRFVELTLWPDMRIPAHRVTALTEWMVLAGGATINNVPVPIGAVVVIEAGTEVSIESQFGCRLLAWADGPITWSEGQSLPDIYGF
ncbi:cupin domain-containing protein [Sphingomonas naphthae]|uniref:Cupin domain-containing protein n=1 Tax=Sphingomonas naphthae TaxID=1813468 RepID=A0ABY7TML8_9SPHN|nr:cupin domain-containing protein [Sphingomonas naphthae]WCT74478.1 cupin domain-containing protein [Sphingomonas naphthae]